VHFPLHPETPAAGLALTDLFRGRDLEGMHQAMSERMAAAGLAYSDQRTMTYNTRLAQELAAWADSQPGGDAIHNTLFRAYFVENRNIGQIEVLLDIAGSMGLDAAQARQVLEQRTQRAQVDKDWQYSHATGITGVPAFLAGNQVVVGCQPYEVLEKFIRHVQSSG